MYLFINIYNNIYILYEKIVNRKLLIIGVARKLFGVRGGVWLN